MDAWDPMAMHERLLASHREDDDDLDGPPTGLRSPQSYREAIERRIAALRAAIVEEGEAGMYWAAGIDALKAENWERRLAAMTDGGAASPLAPAAADGR